MHFYLFGSRDEALRLKSFSSQSRNGRHTIKIELETTSGSHLGYTLDALAQVQEGQRAQPEKPKPKTKAKPLALPAPSLALSAPEGRDET
ncbi:MAG: hypothetical protein ACK46Q_12815 [Hyphomonas sp.]